MLEPFHSFGFDIPDFFQTSVKRKMSEKVWLPDCDLDTAENQGHFLLDVDNDFRQFQPPKAQTPNG
jgi:hypothetical protein